jgi:hypothetical protein
MEADMNMRLLWLGVVAVLATVPLPPPMPTAVPTAQAADATSADLAGKWTYRSFHNRAEFVGGDQEKALKLIFAEATFTFEITSPTTLKGTIDWGSGGLDLQGTIRPAGAGAPLTVEIIGTGRPGAPGTGTAGWEYDYYAHLAYKWPNGIDQVPALVGTVIRAKPHGDRPAGYVASFVAVKQP